MKRIFYLILLSFLFFHCQPIEVPEPMDDDPIFVVNGLIDGDSLNLAAGLNDYFLFTYFNKDSVDVYTFWGNLAPENCPTCGPSLRIGIRNEEVINSPDQIDILDVLEESFRDFYSNEVETETTYTVAFEPQFSTTTGELPSTYIWDFGDGEISNEPNPVHMYDDDSDRTVKLTIIDTLLYESSKSKTVRFGNIPVLDGEINGQHIEGTYSYELTAIPENGSSPYSYSWTDGSVTSSIIYPFNQVAGSTFQCVTIADNFGDQTEICKTIILSGSNPANFEYHLIGTDFTYEATMDTNPIFDPFQFATVYLEYTDEQGTLYTSNELDQSPNAFFEIMAVELFDPNENGETTVKLTINVNCTLYELGNPSNSIELSANSLVWAVAYP